MRLDWALLFTILACIQYARAGYGSGINLYSDRYNTLDVDTILNSDRLVTNYVDCLLSRKPCSPEGKELKRALPEALRTKCAKCSNRQKEAALKVLKKLYVYYPKHYNDLRARWDRTGEYNRRFEEFLREEQFNSIPNDRLNSFDYDRDQTQIDIQRVQTNGNIVPHTNVQLPNQQQIPPVTATPPTQVPTIDTQRPARNPDGTSNAGSNSIQGTQPQLLRPVQEVPFDIGNRFSEDDLSDSAQPVNPPTARPIPSAPPMLNPTYLPITQPPSVSPSVVTTARPTARPSALPTVTSRPIDRTPPSTPSVAIIPSLIDHFFVPPQQQNGGPFFGFINRIGTKITNTADFIADMLRNTVKTS